MDKIKQKKELIFFDNTGYQYGLNKYKELDSIAKILEKKICKLLETESFDINKLYQGEKGIDENLLTLIADKYKSVNDMNLSPKMLCKVKELDISPILNNSYLVRGELENLKPPKKENYSHYTKNKKQLDKLNALNNFIKGFEGLSEYGTLNPMNFVRGSNGKLSYDSSRDKVVPNYRWVQDLDLRGF